MIVVAVVLLVDKVHDNMNYKEVCRHYSLNINQFDEARIAYLRNKSVVDMINVDNFYYELHNMKKLK